MNIEHSYLLIAAGGLAAAFWQHLKSLGAKLASKLIDVAEVHDKDAKLATAFYAHIQRYPRTRLGNATYLGGRIHVRSRKGIQLVPYSVVAGNWVYWIGRYPLLVNWEVQGSYVSLKCYSLRGTVDVEALLLAAADGTYDQIETSRVHEGPSRFSVRCVTGYRKGSMTMSGGDAAAAPKADVFGRSAPQGSVPDAWAMLRDRFYRLAVRPIGFDHDDLVEGSPLAGSAIDRLALSPAVLAAVAGVRDWHAAREWYATRDIPWRHGVAFVGSPGNGKTRLVAALGQDLDMPVLLFDLASLTNPEFLHAWANDVRAESPCIALFEDLDSVFNGRENVSGLEGGLTFDCFLNALGGVEVADGVLVIITTNRPETLDPALAQVDKASRPGRIESVVELGPPDEAGRYKIAARVLVDEPAAIDYVVAAGAGESGAVFLDRCRRMALASRAQSRTLTTVTG